VVRSGEGQGCVLRLCSGELIWFCRIDNYARCIHQRCGNWSERAPLPDHESMNPAAAPDARKEITIGRKP